MPPTEDLAHNPGVCPDWESNRLPFGSQAGTRSTEPHQPEPKVILSKAAPGVLPHLIVFQSHSFRRRLNETKAVMN